LAAIAALAVVAAIGPAEAQDFDSVVVVDQAAGTVTYTITGFGPVVIADGLVNPRGLAMSPDGAIIVVAESGDGPGQGRLVGIEPNLDLTVLVDGLNFPEGVVFIDDTTMIVSSVPDQTLSEYVLGDTTTQTLITLQSPPTGMVTLPVGPAGGFPPVAVSTWNGLGLIFDEGNITPFTEPLGGGGHPGFDPDLGVCFPEFDQDWVSCWPVDGGQPQLLQGFNHPVGVAILPSGLLAVADSTGVHSVDPRDGSVLFTAPFENQAAMVVPGDRDRVWIPALQTDTTTSTTSSSTTSTTTGTDTSDATTSTTATGTESTGATAAPAPSSTAVGQDSGGSSGAWWWLVALIPLLLALALLARRRGRPNPATRPDESEPNPPTGEVAIPAAPAVTDPPAVSKDPCQELCDAAQRAADEAEKAEAAADAAEKTAADAEQQATDSTSRAADADKKAAAASHEADRADRGVDKAKQPADHSGGRAESGDSLVKFRQCVVAWSASLFCDSGRKFTDVPGKIH